MMTWLKAGASSGAGSVERRAAIVLARERVAGLLGARSEEEIIFTSGAAESVNMAVKGVAWATEGGGRIVLGSVEHVDVLNSVRWLASCGFEISQLRAGADGCVNLHELRPALEGGAILLCLQLANHDVGALQSVREASVIAAKHGVPLFVDATAWNGTTDINFREMGASLAALAPHRFGGPLGCGILWRRPGIPLVPLIHGGDQEFGLRAGIENVAAIVGAGVAAEIAMREQEEQTVKLRELQRAFLAALTSRIDHIRLTGPPPGERRLPGHLSFLIEFVEAEGLKLMLDLQGVTIGAGPSCISKSAAAENPLHEMGIAPELSRGAIRLTLGRDNSMADVEPAADAIARAVEKFRALSPDWEDFTAGRRPALL